MASCAHSVSSSHRGVGGEGVERQAAGAGCLERLDAILDLRVLAVGRFECGDVRVGLVGDEALEAIPVGSIAGEAFDTGADWGRRARRFHLECPLRCLGRARGSRRRSANHPSLKR
jgi:hypothetical protein